MVISARQCPGLDPGTKHCKNSWNPHRACCCCCCVASVVSDSVRPHRWQPTRLPRPWDSPGKNTGVGCHFLLQLVQFVHLLALIIFVFYLQGLKYVLSDALQVKFTKPNPHFQIVPACLFTFSELFFSSCR